jgi:phospholipid-binding lipoprotein MlaA
MKRLYPLSLLLFLGITSCTQRPVGIQALALHAAEAPESETEMSDLEDPGDDASMESFEDDSFADFDEDSFADFDDEFAAQETDAYDPIESWNRGVFRFNDKAYAWVLRPIVRAYRFVTPEPVRLGTRNFFHNMIMPVRAMNCLLQGKFRPAGIEVARFAVNSVVGVLGCADPAEEVFGWEAQNEDLGQTLGAWGVAEGPYLVWPLMGPSTLRDSGARVGDYFFQPLSYVDAFELELFLKGIEYGNLASFSLEQYETIQEEALEPYIAIREGYLQYRRQVIQE